MNLYKVKRFAYNYCLKLFNNKFFLWAMMVAIKIKIIKPTNSSFNLLVGSHDQHKGNVKTNSLPSSAALNVTNLCNYRCKFCEINYFYSIAKEKSGRVFPNNLTVEDLNNYHEWLKNLISLELSANVGEPFLNPDFIEIIKHLRQNYPNLILSTTTNGVLINESQIIALIDYKFNKLLFSIHGGDVDCYRELQGGDLNKVLYVINRINKRKAEKHSVYPFVGINFALNKINASSVLSLIDKLSNNNLDALVIQHYYDGRNEMKTQYDIKDISYYFDIEACNQMLDKIYDYAKQKKVCLSPKEPLYLQTINQIDDADEAAGGENCPFPWRVYKLKGCVEEENCVYLSVCNRILLFKLNYKEFYKNGGKFNDIWNHSLLQYLRKTVGTNSICKFCKNPKTKKIRCLDNANYSIIRDVAIKSFFEEFEQHNEPCNNPPGLEVLNEHPYKFYS